MKKIFISLIVLALAITVMAAQRTVTERDVSTPRLLRDAINNNANDAQTRLTAAEGTVATALQPATLAKVDTNATVTTTLHAPAFVGQLLIGTASNTVWVAVGATTNDWVAVLVAEE